MLSKSDSKFARQKGQCNSMKGNDYCGFRRERTKGLEEFRMFPIRGKKKLSDHQEAALSISGDAYQKCAGSQNKKRTRTCLQEREIHSANELLYDR